MRRQTAELDSRGKQRLLLSALVDVCVCEVYESGETGGGCVRHHRFRHGGGSSRSPELWSDATICDNNTSLYSPHSILTIVDCNQHLCTMAKEEKEPDQPQLAWGGAGISPWGSAAAANTGTPGTCYLVWPGGLPVMIHLLPDSSCVSGRHCYTFNGYDSPWVPDIQSCSNFQDRLISPCLIDPWTK